MTSALHEAVATRARQGGMPVGAEGVAFIDQLLAEQRNEIACGGSPLSLARDGGAGSSPSLPASPGAGGRAA